MVADSRKRPLIISSVALSGAWAGPQDGLWWRTVGALQIFLHTQDAVMASIDLSPARVARTQVPASIRDAYCCRDPIIFSRASDVQTHI